MKVMPSAIGQIGQNVADNIFEIGQSAVKATGKALTDVVGETIEQVTTAPSQAAPKAKSGEQGGGMTAQQKEEKKAAEKRRFEEVKADLASYIQRKQAQDQQIAKEKAEEQQQTEQKKVVEKKERESWVSRMINRSQTGTEKGRSSE